MDARGGTIMPGLVEAHFHATYFNIAALEDLDIKYPVEYVSLLASVNSKLAIECGYTAARSGGCLFNVDFWLKKAIEEDLIAGPRLSASGREICSAGGLMDWNPEFRKIGMEGLVFIINGQDDARKAVRALVKDGVEWVKTYPTGDAASPDINDHHTLCMTFEEMNAVVNTAHNHGLKVTGHCRATEGIKNALRAGYDCIEHGTFMDDEALDLLLQRDVPCVPALYFEKASVELGPEFGLSQRVIDGHQETLDGGIESARRILRAGGRLGMGGDYGFGWNPHGDYARELTFFVKDVGLTPLEVLTCATKTGAEIMGRSDEFGTLEKGKLADMYSTMMACKAYVYAVGQACDRAKTPDAVRALRKDAAGAILYSAEKATWMAGETIQALGGNGYINEYPAGRLWRDAKLYEIGAGTSEIRRMLIGRELFAETA
jgi:imidazolonepropionase-like amidohydrolase